LAYKIHYSLLTLSITDNAHVTKNFEISQNCNHDSTGITDKQGEPISGAVTACTSLQNAATKKILPEVEECPVLDVNFSAVEEKLTGHSSVGSSVRHDARIL
jgi:hypothetical protein